MKGITLTQPWASLVAIGAKHVETRCWATSYRGPIVIHAAKGLPRKNLGTEADGLVGLSEKLHTPPFDAFDLVAEEMPLGAIIATTELLACVRMDELRATLEMPQFADWKPATYERAFGDYSHGRYAWLLGDVEPLAEPIPIRGALGLWNVPEDILEQLQGVASA